MLWILCAIAAAISVHADALATHVLVGLGIALPALLRRAYVIGRSGEIADGRRQAKPNPPLGPRLDPAGGRADPLRRPGLARSVTAIIVATAGVALALSLDAGAPRQLPDAVLSSPALFHLLRAGAATLAAAFFLVFVVRAAGGYFPQKVSTTGAEWPGTEAVAQSSEASQSAAAGVEELGMAVESLKLARGADRQQIEAELDALVTLVADAMNRQGLSIAALQRVALRNDPTAADELREAPAL